MYRISVVYSPSELRPSHPFYATIHKAGRHVYDCEGCETRSKARRLASRLANFHADLLAHGVTP